MEDNNNEVKTNAPTASAEEVAKVALPAEEDLQAKIKSLEEEKARLISDNANYKVGIMKAKSKQILDTDEDEDERMRRIASEAVADSRLAEIAREQQAIIDKALKENRELKLAQLNKGNVPVSVGSSNTGTPVKDTTITPEQAAYFKANNWSDKDIERYKKNLLRYAR